MIKAICLQMKTVSTSQTWCSKCYKQKPKASWPGPEEIAGVMQFSAFKKKKEKKKIRAYWVRDSKQQFLKTAPCLYEEMEHGP